MQKVEKTLGNFILSSVHEVTFNREETTVRCIDADKRIKDKISELENRLSELKELQEFIKTGNQIYFFEGGGSEFSYVDKTGNHYEYKKAHGKHILIDKEFNIYEIIEYTSVNDITDKTDFSLRINKIVKVKPLKE